MDQTGLSADYLFLLRDRLWHPHYLPYDEAHPVAPVNVYGRTKAMVEDIISDWAVTGAGRSAALLRYFNPVGAHESGEIGEDPKGHPE